MKPSAELLEFHMKVEKRLRSIEKLVPKGYVLTLVVRDPETDDGLMMLTKDHWPDVVEAVNRVESRPDKILVNDHTRFDA